MIPQMGDPRRVRVADARDEDCLMQHCKAMHAEHAMFSFSEQKVAAKLRGALEGPIPLRTGLIGVIGPYGHLQGSIYLQVGANWFSDDLYLDEIWNYVRPEFRNSSNSSDLIAFAKAMADQFRVALTIGVLSNVRTAAKVRLYRRQLGEPAGAFFVHRCGGGIH